MGERELLRGRGWMQGCSTDRERWKARETARCTERERERKDVGWFAELSYAAPLAKSAAPHGRDYGVFAAGKHFLPPRFRRANETFGSRARSLAVFASVPSFPAERKIFSNRVSPLRFNVYLSSASFASFFNRIVDERRDTK